MPRTFMTFCAGWLAISGIPPLAGFFSKDEILAGAWNGNRFIWITLTVAALLTAFYMTRLVYLVFFGEFRGTDKQWQGAHESPATMTIPLMVLAVLSVVGGWIGIPKVMSGWFGAGDINSFHHWLEPAITVAGGGGHAPAGEGHGEAAAHASAGVESMLILLATLVAAVGIGLAWTMYKKPGAPQKLATASGPIYPLLRNLYWVDEFYEAVILKPFYAMSRWFSGFDRWIVDGVVNATGVTADITGQVIKLFQTGLVRNYALMFLVGVVAILFYLMGV